jgi:hypothetical protein
MVHIVMNATMSYALFYQNFNWFCLYCYFISIVCGAILKITLCDNDGTE